MIPKTFLFFNMGAMEILIVLFFVLMFFGAESIPKVARGLGRGIRQIKDATEEIKSEMMDSARDVQKEIEKNRSLLDDPEDTKKS